MGSNVARPHRQPGHFGKEAERKALNMAGARDEAELMMCKAVEEVRKNTLVVFDEHQTVVLEMAKAGDLFASSEAQASAGGALNRALTKAMSAKVVPSDGAPARRPSVAFASTVRRAQSDRARLWWCQHYRSAEPGILRNPRPCRGCQADQSTLRRCPGPLHPDESCHPASRPVDGP